jgi:hypothetical protein
MFFNRFQPSKLTFFTTQAEYFFLEKIPILKLAYDITG